MIQAPDQQARAAARRRVDALAKPRCSLGRLEDLAVWWAGVRGDADAPPPQRPALVVVAADHGITDRGVSAYPAAVTAAMVATMLAGRAAVTVLAAEAGVTVRILDVGVDTDWAGMSVPATLTGGKTGGRTAPLDTDDAMDHDRLQGAVAHGARVADELVDAGHDVLMPGDMGIGNTTAAAAVVAALTGAAADAVVGRGTGIDDTALARKERAVAAALHRVAWTGDQDPWEAVRRLGGPDIAALAGLYGQAARRRTPVLLDGVVSTAAALVAAAVDPGVRAWFAAGHVSTEPAHAVALAGLGLRPLLDLDLRLGEGSGALLALPLLRSAVRLGSDMATLAEVEALMAGSAG